MHNYWLPAEGTVLQLTGEGKQHKKQIFLASFNLFIINDESI